MTGVGFVELPPWYPPWRGDDWGNNVVYCNNFTVTDEDGEPGGTTVFGGAFNLIFNNKINDTDGAIVMSPFNGYNIGRMPARDPTIGNVVHGPFYGGNYWTGYTGMDLTLDLIGDTPPIPQPNPFLPWGDWFPLIKAKCGDVNCEGIVNMADVGAMIAHIFWGVPLYDQYPEYSWPADVNCDGAVNMVDVGAMLGHIFQGVSLNNCCEGCV